MQSERLSRLAIEALEDLKAVDIVRLEVRKLSDFTDYMIIASGRSARQVVALAEHLVMKAKEAGEAPLGVEFAQGPLEPALRSVEASQLTINGRYEIGWEITEDAFECRVLVPGNCTAELRLPDGTREQIDAGPREFDMPLSDAGDGIPVLREVS